MTGGRSHGRRRRDRGRRRRRPRGRAGRAARPAVAPGASRPQRRGRPVPDVAPGRVVSGSFVVRAPPRRETGWSVIHRRAERRAAAGHGRAARPRRRPRHAAVAALGLDRFLAAAVAAGVPPFAIATVDGGTTYWHPRPDGRGRRRDGPRRAAARCWPSRAARPTASALHGLVDGRVRRAAAGRARSAPPRVPAVVGRQRRPLDRPRRRLAVRLRRRRGVRAVHRARPPGATCDGIAVRVDCGTDDPFYRDVPGLRRRLRRRR